MHPLIIKTAMQRRALCPGTGHRHLPVTQSRGRMCRAKPLQLETRQQDLQPVSNASSAGTPRNVAIFVEPSPFSHISGMKNRFESLIKGLREAGDDVMVVTPDPSPPKEFCGAQVRLAAATVATAVAFSCDTGN